MSTIHSNFSEYPCAICGGHWENVVISNGTYIFTCDRCGHEKFRTQDPQMPLRSKEM